MKFKVRGATSLLYVEAPNDCLPDMLTLRFKQPHQKIHKRPRLG